jgi:hypothetical protein
VTAPPQPLAVEPSHLTPIPPDPPPDQLGSVWGSAEFLVWWPKSQPLPPLAVGGPGAGPVLGRAGTTLLIGPGSVDGRGTGGGRFTIGTALDCTNTVGAEATYFFLGTRTLSADAADPRGGSLGLPFVSAVSGVEDAVVLAAPGVSTGAVAAAASTRVQGAELNLVANLLATDRLRVHGLAGYRFLQVQEGLRVEGTSFRPDANHQFADQFDAHNRFSGGQLGVRMDYSRGSVFVEFTGKMAVGRSYEVVRIDGRTDRVTAGRPAAGATFPGGVYALPSNAGRFVNEAFAVVPETTFKVGLQSAGRSRIYVGYNFLYLNDAVRPGDQIDRALNPGQIPLLNPSMAATGPDRPLALLRRGDFWVQGLVIGVEGRY